MDINKKKVLLIPLDNTLTDGGGVTDIHIHREILDRIRQLNISRVAIIYGDSEDKDYHVKVKAIEFFVFAYCVVAVSSHKRSDVLLNEVMEMLPHSIRKKDNILSVGEKIPGVDFMTREDFV